MKILKTLCVTVGLVLALSAACDRARQQPAVDDRRLENSPAIDEQQLLDDTFRIDIQTIEVTFDYFPEQSYVHGRAEVTFQMRPGQTRPLIHFDPAVRGQPPHLIRLDGEVLDFDDPADVRIVEFDGSSQKALEFQRHPADNMDHTITMTYRLDLPQGYPRFSPDVNDIEGTGNEEIFPTLNTPHELARHRLFINVHGSSPFRCLGSGLVEPVSGPVQAWVLDSEREVASYTLFFVVVPAEDVLYRTRTINGVEVRIMAFIGGAAIDEAFAALESWLPELEANLGPFPMPRGLSIFLARFGGGMEFYGGTITSLSVLEHEVFHMYFGCSTVAKTYRDSWWDEAINMWYEYSADPEFAPIPESYRSNIVSGRSPIAVGFDPRAYDEGARIFQAVAVELGGRGAMIGFLRYLHQNHTFAPFTTIDLLDYLEDYAGVDMHDRFIDWLYNGDRIYSAAASVSPSPPLPQGRKVDLTPPEAILKKYTHRQSGERQN